MIIIILIAAAASCNLFYDYRDYAGNGGTILDGDTVTFTVTVSGATRIMDFVSVTLSSLSHIYASDLDVSLTSPAGTTVNLFSDIGDYYDFDGTYTITAWDTFSNDPDPDITDASNHVTLGVIDQGEYQAEGDISEFENEDPNGTWTLTVTDDFMDGNNGSLGKFIISFGM